MTATSGTKNKQRRDARKLLVVIVATVMAACGTHSMNAIPGGGVDSHSASGSSTAVESIDSQALRATDGYTTVAEYLGYDDPVLGQEREVRRFDRVQSAIASCMGARDFDYKPVPMDVEFPQDQTSPVHQAAAEGFGVADMILRALVLPPEDHDEAVSDETVARDPNVRYIEGLSREEQAEYFAAHAACGEAAHAKVYGQIWKAQDAVQTFIDEAAERTADDPAVAEAAAEWADCASEAAGVSLSSKAELNDHVKSEFFDVASSFAKVGDIEGIETLRGREVELAVAIQNCHAQFQESIAPVVRRYEGEMLLEHAQEFQALRETLDA